MRVAIAVVPSGVVLVVGPLGAYFFEQVFEILHQARFIFDGSEGAGGPGHEESDDPVVEAFFPVGNGGMLKMETADVKVEVTARGTDATPRLSW